MTRSKIDGTGTSKANARLQISNRAKKGKLTVIERHCPYCHHNKAFSTITKIKCTLCGRRIKK